MSPEQTPMSPMSPAPGLLAGRTILVTGVLRPTSIATSIAALAHQEGARVLLTGAPATIGATRSLARRLGLEEALALDASDPGQLAALEAGLRAAGLQRLDGLVHAIAHADRGLLGAVLPDQGQEVAPEQARLRQRRLQEAFTASVASLAGLTQAVRPLLAPGSSVVALTFESTRAHPGYGWMGPLKAALESSVRYLAAELGGQGVRVNALSCGPLRTPAASAIPGLDDMAARWARAAPLGWEARDAGPVARSALALLSDWLPATTGQVLRADGGAFLAGP
ncbi:SDR family oxidoreductase [Actinomyces bowdenii]|uniref:SDR family oxidoreductase n=1 Tax=Actinomyces bowdenii TaxID=131109 RepID=UPI001FBAF05E|nr:SDR family oxidoreductase [Actinomyces bowdenii]